MTLSKNTLKYIRSLKDKKSRLEHNTFVAEGDKMVSELLSSMSCRLLLGTRSFLNTANLQGVEEIIEVDAKEMSQASFLQTPQQALAVFYQADTAIDIDLSSDLCLALDGVQDPGNMGTIVRLADWYGIRHIFCSPHTADVYNPKVVQATMGALARVSIHYLDLPQFLLQHATMPIYGTLLKGDDMYEQALSPNGILVMGNEGGGIGAEVEQLINRKLYIPNYPRGSATSQSLNVAIATAIVCAEFRRRCL